MSHSHEPSYYEIALTNRQVLSVFLVLLICVVAAFFSGVWVGRRGSEPTPQVAEVPADETVPGVEEEPLRELRFFTDDAAGRPAQAPLEKVVEAPRSDTTLVEDVGGEPDSRASETRQVDRRPPEEAAPSAAAPKPTETTAPAAGDHVVQVFSSSDEAQAKRLVTRLSNGGYPAYLSPVEVRGQTLYRVRVGPYGERNEAEAVAERVKRAFKLDTWVTQSEQL